MRRSFFTKLFLGNLLLIAIIIGIGGGVSYRRLNEVHLAESRNHQLRIVQFAQLHFQDVWRQSLGEVDFIDRECKAFGVESPMRLTVIAFDGRVLGDSEADPAAMKNHKTADRPEIMQAMKGLSGDHARRSETLGVEFRYLARPIRHGKKVVGVVRVAMPMLAVIQSQTFIRNALLWAALAAVVAAIALALLLSWIWYAPLRQIAQTARTLAAGDLSRRAAISGSGELAQLAAALNEMRDSIRLQIDQIATQRRNLVAVVENLREGVTAVTGQGRILLMNRSAAELLAEEPAEDVEGKPFQTVVCLPEIVEVYNEIVQDPEPISRQVEVGSGGRRQVLDVDAARLAEGSAEGLAVLLVVRDVTHLVRMAAVKAEFVANASHELRTPLATIRAAVDSLTTVEPGETDELTRIAQILDRHTTRLEEMTSDLLSLHLVETARHRPRREPIVLSALAEWVRENFSRRAGEKGISLSAQASDPDAEMSCDRTLVELILQNLLDNAVKFTPAGGEVSCRLEADRQHVRLVVRDTGCGIAPEIQDRVFERFFQADVSRSGQPKARGTGLGLAIVKHAADRLGATVDLESRPGEGTTVTVTVPGDVDHG